VYVYLLVSGVFPANIFITQTRPHFPCPTCRSTKFVDPAGTFPTAASRKTALCTFDTVISPLNHILKFRLQTLRIVMLDSSYCLSVCLSVSLGENLIFLIMRFVIPLCFAINMLGYVYLSNTTNGGRVYV